MSEDKTAFILGRIASPFLVVMQDTLRTLCQMDLLGFPKER